MPETVAAELQGSGQARQRIVVGVDGSEASKEALRWATQEARLREAMVHVVHAWSYPVTAAYGPYAPSIPLEELQKAEEQVAREAVAEVAKEDAGVGISVETVSGPAALALVEAAKGADLLVVGSRGLGGFSGLLLGSVSQQCAHHAPCPLVIIRSAGDP